MKRLIILWLVFVIAGCASAGNRNITDVSRTSQIIEDISNKEDVRAALGSPSNIFFDSAGREIWSYVYGTGQVKPATFIPVVGIVAGGAKSTSNTYTVYFNKQGIVENIGQGKTDIQSGLLK